MDRGGLLKDDQAVQANLQARAGVHVFDAVIRRTDRIARGRDNLAQLISRGESRVAVLLGTNYTISLSRHSLATNGRLTSVAERAAKKIVEIPPLDVTTLEMILERGKRKFRMPMIATMKGDISRLFRSLTDNMNLKEFKATQSDLVDKIVAIHQAHDGIDSGGYRKDITECVRNTAAVVSMTSTFPSPDVDYLAAVAACGFSTETPLPGDDGEPSGWRDLRPAPLENPGLNMKPHQVLGT